MRRRIRQLKRGVLPSVVALQEAINGFVASHNREPKPFVWKADPKAIIAQRPPDVQLCSPGT